MQAKSKIILFLDFDGVLHPYGCRQENLMCHLSFFESLIKRYENVQIVISSSWKNVKTLEELKNLFSDEVASRIIGVTPTICKLTYDHCRYNEIMMFMESLNIHDWVAVDDNYQSFPRGCYNLVRCNPNTGIDEAVLKQLSFRLNIMSAAHKN